MNDSERLAWLDIDDDRLEDVRGRMNNEGETVREAIDALSGDSLELTEEFVHQPTVDRIRKMMARI